MPMKTTAPLPPRHFLGGPVTALGRWAMRLEGLFLLFLLLFYGGALTGQSGGGPGTGFFWNPYLALTILAAGISAAGTGVLATTALALRHERSVLLVAIAVVGLLVLLVTLGEIGSCG